MTAPRPGAVALLAAVLLVLAPIATLHAQSDADSLRLGTLHAGAVRRDPRGRQLDLLDAQSALRLRTLAAERLPTLGVVGLGQYQSDVTRLPIRLPDGSAPAGPRHDTFDARVEARQRLYDPSRAPRRAVEEAQRDEAQARVRAALFTVRQAVNEAFFPALRLQAEGAVLEAGLVDLEAQRRVSDERVRAGAALPSDVAALDAELLRRRQVLAELAADRDAAIVVLADLTGRAPGATQALALPDLAREVADARGRMGELRARPEYAQFARTREVLARQRAAVTAHEKPRVAAFGRAGYGRPGLNPLARELDEYWVAGVQLEWAPWNWGATAASARCSRCSSRSSARKKPRSPTACAAPSPPTWRRSTGWSGRSRATRRSSRCASASSPRRGCASPRA
jgi:outer membrane protein TolC